MNTWLKTRRINHQLESPVYFSTAWDATSRGQVQGKATDSGDNEGPWSTSSSTGETGRLRAEMDHNYAFPSISVFIEKHNRYSNWEAQACKWKGGGGAETSRPQAWQIRMARRIKRLSHHLPLPGPTLPDSLYVYLWQGGIWSDGRAGYNFARLHGIYEFMSVAKAQELRLQMATQSRAIECSSSKVPLGQNTSVPVTIHPAR